MAETKNIMNMESGPSKKGGFRKNVEKIARAGVLVGSLLSPEGAQAGKHAEAKLQTEITMAEFDANNATNPAKKLEAQRKLVLLKAKQNELVAKEEDEKREKAEKREKEQGTRDFNEKTRVAGNADFFNKNKAEKTVAYRVTDVLDANGNKIGEAVEGSKDWKKLEELRIKANRAIEKEKAKSNRPIIIGDGYHDNYYNGPGYVRGRGVRITSAGSAGSNIQFRTGPRRRHR